MDSKEPISSLEDKRNSNIKVMLCLFLNIKVFQIGHKLRVILLALKCIGIVKYLLENKSPNSILHKFG